MAPTEALLHQLVAEAGLPAVESFEPLRGHGFDHEILQATLIDSRQVVLRHRPQHPRPLPVGLARFLAAHNVPAPALLAGNSFATLYEYASGEMLSALVAEGRVSDDDWRSVGTTFRRLHDIRFPKGLAGVLTEDELVLELVDPANALHELLVEAEPELKVKLPVVVPHLPRLHAVIDQNALALRETATSLLHLDVNPANIIVGPTRTTLIDWGEPGVDDPARESAALEEHIYLINGSEIPATFYETYGPRSLPNTAIYRLTGAINWYCQDDFDEWATEDGLDPVLKAKAAHWQAALATYLAAIDHHLKAF